jgi:hypothetical protein
VSTKDRAWARLAKRSGNRGVCLRVLNWASENGLALDTWGREWERVTPKSARSWAGWYLFGAGGDEFLGESVGLVGCDEPSDGVAGVDVQDHVEGADRDRR